MGCLISLSFLDIYLSKSPTEAVKYRCLFTATVLELQRSLCEAVKMPVKQVVIDLRVKRWFVIPDSINH